MQKIFCFKFAPMNEVFFKRYCALQTDVDNECNRLELMHKTHMKCSIGCDSCCESLTLFPIEYYYIKSQLEDFGSLPKNRLINYFTKACRFLVNGKCSIYKIRPIICRTQGLPLLYENSYGTGFELSACKLNFKGIDISIFNTENSLYMPPFTSRLFLLNQNFIENNFNDRHTAVDRLSLNRI